MLTLKFEDVLANRALCNQVDKLICRLLIWQLQDHYAFDWRLQPVVLVLGKSVKRFSIDRGLLSVLLPLKYDLSILRLPSQLWLVACVLTTWSESCRYGQIPNIQTACQKIFQPRHNGR